MSRNPSSEQTGLSVIFTLVGKFLRYVTLPMGSFKWGFYLISFSVSYPILSSQNENVVDIHKKFEAQIQAFLDDIFGSLPISPSLLSIALVLGVIFVPWKIHETYIKRQKPWGYFSLGVFALVSLYSIIVYSLNISYEKASFPILFGTVFISIGLYRFINPGRWVDNFFKKVPGKSSHGTSRFLSDTEVDTVLNTSNKGLVMDGKRRISMADSFENCLVVAPTGSGKTQSYVLPNILNADDYSLIVTDPSGEIYASCSQNLAKKGYEVRAIRPYQLQRSDRYNPLHNISNLSDAKIVSKTVLSQIETKSDPYWHNAASQLLAALIMLLSDMSGSHNYRNFSNVRRLLLKSEEQLKLLCDELGSESTKEEIYQTFIGSEKAKEGIKSTLLTAIELFSSDNFKKLTSSHNVNFSDLRAKKTALFLIIPEEKIKGAKAFISLFYTQLFEYLLSHSDGLPVFTFLEEFANTGYIPDFSQTITVSRKRRISMSIVIQEIGQIEALYKGQLETIISGGCQHKLFYSGLGLKTSEYVSKLLGDTTIDVVSQSETGFKIGSQTQSTSRRLLTADEVRRIDRNEAIYVTQNIQPMVLNVTRAYENPELKSIIDKADSNSLSFSTRESDDTVDIPLS